jgi:beta-glucanase (GH16 family)
MKYISIITAIAFIGLAACTMKGNKNDYKLVWSDEFNGAGLPDAAKWGYDTAGNDWGWGNKELQYYTDQDEENSYQKDGYLHIVAIREPMPHKDYSSARLITKNKGDWKYGRVEINAKIPGARGIWPAIWMLPTKNTYGIWPASGEIDIMEHVGFNPDSVFASSHCQSYYFKVGTQKTKGYRIPSCTEQFHTYAMEWDSTQISMYVDTVKYFTFKNEGTGFKEWPFDQPFYLILNVAVGGYWGGVMGVDTTAYPQEMLVDYVRVYQK